MYVYLKLNNLYKIIIWLLLVWVFLNIVFFFNVKFVFFLFYVYFSLKKIIYIFYEYYVVNTLKYYTVYYNIVLEFYSLSINLFLWKKQVNNFNLYYNFASNKTMYDNGLLWFTCGQ